MLPRGGNEPPGTRLAALRAAAVHTGWGAGIAATAALVGAVCVEEDARVAVVAAPLVAAAAAIAGYDVVVYGEPPPGRPLPVVPLLWGETVSPLRPRRFDAVAVDATGMPLAATWLAGLLPYLAGRGRHTRLAILCRAEDAFAYSACPPSVWITTIPSFAPDALPVVLLHTKE